MWKNNPLLIEVKSTPITLKCSSPRHFQLWLGFAVLLLFCVGWLAGSGLVALKRSFMPSEQMQAQRQRLEYSLRSEPLSLRMERLNRENSGDSTVNSYESYGRR